MSKIHSILCKDIITNEQLHELKQLALLKNINIISYEERHLFKCMDVSIANNPHPIFKIRKCELMGSQLDRFDINILFITYDEFKLLISKYNG